MRRVVITGIGAVTPLGNNMESTWNNLTNGVSGISRITRFDPAGLRVGIAGELKDFAPENYLGRKDILRLDPFIHYSTAAAMMACEDAKLIPTRHGDYTDLKTLNPEPFNNAGVIIGSSRGGITSLEKALERHLLEGRPFSAYLMSSSTINMASSIASIEFGIKGLAIGISTACASGTNAIGEAFRMIRTGVIDLALAGGAEAPLCRLAVGGYEASGALSKSSHKPEKASRPFDRDRDGFVISEGAGVLVLEELNHAMQRGVKIYAELSGYGTSSDSFHQTRPDSGGEAAAIISALKDAGVAPGQVDYINAHATSTPLGDAAEAGAIKKVFGRRANDIYISSCKSMLGHMLGAGGAVETAITAISIDRGIITPAINLEIPDPECDLNVATSTSYLDINIAISNSFGFGGVNAVLVLKKTGI